MKYRFKNISDALIDIVLKLSAFSLANIEWGCLYSGAGIIDILSEKDVQRLNNACGIKNIQELTKDVALLKCIYKKAKSSFTSPPDEIINPGRYMWDFTSFNKEISLSSQAYGMLSLCRGAEVLMNSRPVTGILMKKSAEAYYDFTTTYLRNDDGLFVSAENKTRFISDELNIKQNKGEPKLLDQVLIHEAFLSLYNLTSNKNIKIYYNSSSDNYLNEANNIFNYLFNNYNLLLESSSRNISQFISSFARCCMMQKDPLRRVNYQHMIALLCAELESRIKITGEVEKNYNDFETASLITHFRVASALLEGFWETGIEKFKEISTAIYQFVENFFDYSLNLFVQGDYKKISYSSRDIAEIIKFLFMYHVETQDERVFNVLNRFYESAVLRSGIVQSIPDRHINLLGYEGMIDECIPLMADSGRAPVFLKSFRINTKKITALTVSKHFSSSHSLYLSYTVLHYLIPLIMSSGPINTESEGISIESVRE
ncbi:hypothetical protein [Fonticella tunisiensis]|uniref:Uncharacterized protein n=1 Tax=Fonticella tunisiensis TaxID=1096341 RepID=A0A4R7KQ77_9CLOT|nr:hypothetical protein [Fonticella tunisiensis]TDT58417.1 hypothetical protein EDD71_11152 [Fonticella tunisiensis]